jgi:hypothetical protein
MLRVENSVPLKSTWAACLAAASLAWGCSDGPSDALPEFPPPIIVGVGGAASAGAGGSQASSGDGGGRSRCGTQLPADPGATFHTTFDDAYALTQLAVGDGSKLVTGGNPSFVASPVIGAVVLEGEESYVGWPQSSNGQLHLYPPQGTVDFCYRPSFDSLDNISHTLMFVPTSNGFLRIRKAGADLDNAIDVTAAHYSVGATQTLFPRHYFVFVAKTWYRITLSWNYNAGPTERHVRLHVDGSEIRPQQFGHEPGKGAFPMDPSSAVMFFYLGTGPGSPGVLPEGADAAFDELVIYAEPRGP